MTTRGKAAEAPAAEGGHLADEAQAQGLERIEGDVMPFGVAALPSAADYGQTARVADLIPTPQAWAEYDQVDLDELVNRDLIIHDAMFFDSAITEGAEWVIVKASDPTTGAMFTTAGGGAIVVRKLRKLMAFPVNGEHRNMLPIVGRFTKTESKTKGHSAYYDLI